MAQNIYDFLDNQTVKQRKDFINSLRESGIHMSNIRNWVNKRCNIPDKYHGLISELAGEDLTYPKLVRKVFIESEA